MLWLWGPDAYQGGLHLRAGTTHADRRQAVHRRVHHGLLYIVSRLCGGVVEIVQDENFFLLAGHIKAKLAEYNNEICPNRVVKTD